MKDYVIKPGLYAPFKCGQKIEGLHLNRLIEDVLRENGYPTKSSTCVQPNLCDLLEDCNLGGSGVTDFLELTDTPNTYGFPRSIVRINNNVLNPALEFGPIVHSDVNNLYTGINATPTIAQFNSSDNRASVVGSMFFGSSTLTLPTITSGQAYTIDIDVTGLQSSFQVSLRNPTMVVHGISGGPVATPVAYQGVFSNAFRFRVSFTAGSTSANFFINVQSSI